MAQEVAADAVARERHVDAGAGDDAVGVGDGLPVLVHDGLDGLVEEGGDEGEVCACQDVVGA